MSHPFLQFRARDEAEMAQLAGLIAERTKNGDTLLLEGEIGAGKSAFARGFIRAKLGRLEDVPSPTFTIVQVYNSDGGEIWHCDLYRLTHPDEALELGLDEAFETAICLVEWPDRLGEEQPETALRLSFAARETHHDVSISGADEWADRLKGLDAKA